MANACALPVAVAGALMPDAHVGYGLPIGGVLATDNAVIPYAVGVDNWLKLPVREHDNAVNTPRGPVLVPTVIVAVNYAKVPLRLPRFGARGIWERDGGVCQYTGRKLSPKEGNIDHVVPRSRGGKTSWDSASSPIAK